MKPRHPLLPELLAPAGDFEKLETAIRYGADAVYLGGGAMNLRAAASGFGPDALNRAVELARASGVRIYFCLNALPLPGDMDRVREQIELLKHADVDGLIAADPGVMRLARKALPHLPLHVSTQANTSNAEAARFWAEMGAARVNLARELSLDDIRRTVEDLGDSGPEIEVFVHGAMCMAVSGQCHMSAWMTGRSANMGRCTHPCRFEYRPVDMSIEERLREGAPCWDVTAGDGWTRILAADDLCLVEHLGELARAGVRAVKIEGRTKSSAYLAQAVDAYRTALDDLAAGISRPSLYLSELANAATRPLCTGFFLPERRVAANPPEPEAKRSVLARILEKIADHAWRIQCKARWDTLRDVDVLRPGCGRPRLAARDYELRDGDGHVHQVLHPGMEAVLHCESNALDIGLFLRQSETRTDPDRS